MEIKKNMNSSASVEVPPTQRLAGVEKPSPIDLSPIAIPPFGGRTGGGGGREGGRVKDAVPLAEAVGTLFPMAGWGRGAGLLSGREITARQRLPAKRNRFLPSKGRPGKGKDSGRFISRAKKGLGHVFVPVNAPGPLGRESRSSRVLVLFRVSLGSHVSDENRTGSKRFQSSRVSPL